MWLEDQLEEIIKRRLGKERPPHSGLLQYATQLAVIAFRDRWPEDADTSAIRHALKVAHENNEPWIRPNEPAWVDSVPSAAAYRCNVPMCGESGVCAECRRRGAR
jgi:hypothetical protein